METPQTRVRIDCDTIVDRDSFHDVFCEAFGFPHFYGRNMSAWIDCLTSLDSVEDGMTQVHALPGGVVVLELKKVKAFKERCPELYNDIIECAAFVNYRKLEVGEPAVLALSFWK